MTCGLNVLQNVDKELYSIISQEEERQIDNIQLIASENIASNAVREAVCSVFANKYAEGYPEKRYYQGCTCSDLVENLAQFRLCKLFDCKYANVQSMSGSQANQAVFLALLNPGDTILGMALDSGGHLTHGSSVNMSGKWFNAVQYPVDRETFLIDMNIVEDLAMKHKPKLIIAGASAYSRVIDFAAFKEVAKKVGAYFLADVAHYSGLIAGGAYPSPFPYADVVTSTTHKTLRGPRGAIIMTNDPDLSKKINFAVFPGMQGGPFMNSIAAKAVAFHEALQDDFKVYTKSVVNNARVFAKILIDNNISVVTGGTDSHIVLVDLRNHGLKGKAVSNDLCESGIVCNKNTVPFDTESPFTTSGLRFGTAFETTRGFDENDFAKVAKLVADCIINRDLEATRRGVNSILSKFKNQS